MTNTEMIKDMLERQKAYDEKVFKKHNIDYVSKAQLESALFDEQELNENYIVLTNSPFKLKFEDILKKYHFENGEVVEND